MGSLTGNGKKTQGRGSKGEARVEGLEFLKFLRCSSVVPHGGRQVPPGRSSRAFTLVELLVVLAIVALLLSIAVPRYFGSLDRSKETVLKENLFQVRESLDKYFSDTGRYPDRIEDLVTRHYLRSAPIDPVTGSTTTWVVVPPRETEKGGVFDIRSGAAGNGKDGTAYRDW